MLGKSIVAVVFAALSVAPAAFAASDAPAAAPAAAAKGDVSLTGGAVAAPAPAAVKPKNRRKTCNDMRVPTGAKANTDAKPANGVKPKVLC